MIIYFHLFLLFNFKGLQILSKELGKIQSNKSFLMREDNAIKYMHPKVQHAYEIVSSSKGFDTLYDIQRMI